MITDTTAAAAELAQVEAARDALDARAKQLRAQLAEGRAPGDTITAPDGTPLYKVATRRTFKPDLAEATLPGDVIPHVTRTTIDGAAVKRLSPALWEACTVESAPHLVRA